MSPEASTAPDGPLGHWRGPGTESPSTVTTKASAEVSDDEHQLQASGTGKHRPLPRQFLTDAMHFLRYLIVARKSAHDILGFLVSFHQRGLPAACGRAPTVPQRPRQHDPRWLPDCIRSPIASERLRGRLQPPVSFCEGNQHDPPRLSNLASALLSLQVRPGSDYGLCTGRANRSGLPGNC